MTTFDIFPATLQGLEESENPTEMLKKEDDQDEELEQSLSDSLQNNRDK